MLKLLPLKDAVGFLIWPVRYRVASNVTFLEKPKNRIARYFVNGLHYTVK
jgi:hypothetical protein